MTLVHFDLDKIEEYQGHIYEYKNFIKKMQNKPIYQILLSFCNNKTTTLVLISSPFSEIKIKIRIWIDR